MTEETKMPAAMVNDHPMPADDLFVVLHTRAQDRRCETCTVWPHEGLDVAREYAVWQRDIAERGGRGSDRYDVYRLVHVPDDTDRPRLVEVLEENGAVYARLRGVGLADDDAGVKTTRQAFEKLQQLLGAARAEP